MEDIKLKYKLKIDTELNRTKILMTEFEDIHNKWNNENISLISSHQYQLKELIELNELKLNNLHILQKNLIDNKNILNINNDNIKNVIELDAENEIEDMKAK